jgi:O-6-methylguanine DNA methyltransferase
MNPSQQPATRPDPVDAALRALHATAPASLAADVLVQLGLADRFGPFESPLGPVFVAWNGLGVSWVGDGPVERFVDGFAAHVGRPLRASPELPADLAGAIGRRIQGDRRARIRLDLRGRTPFETAVLQKAAEIPWGEVRPYGWVAAEIGRPRAVRAVGSALAHNPVPIVVPCHRVVRADGSIGEYSLGGPLAKRRILGYEGLDPEGLEELARRGIRLVGSNTTRIACLPTCHHARRIGPSHRVPFHGLAEAAAAGYRACRHCRPDSGARAA